MRVKRRLVKPLPSPVMMSAIVLAPAWLIRVASNRMVVGPPTVISSLIGAVARWPIRLLARFWSARWLTVRAAEALLPGRGPRHQMGAAGD
jgi:hypothetical protein